MQDVPKVTKWFDWFLLIEQLRHIQMPHPGSAKDYPHVTLGKILKIPIENLFVDP